MSGEKITTYLGCTFIFKTSFKNQPFLYYYLYGNMLLCLRLKDYFFLNFNELNNNFWEINIG